MSDQQDMSDIDGSDYNTNKNNNNAQPLEQEIEVEGLDSMRVRVTNIVDGIFQFARSRSAGGGWSSAGSNAGDATPNNSRPSSPTNGLAGTVRGNSTKKVKFKDHHPPPPPPSAPLAQTTTTASTTTGTTSSETTQSSNNKPLNANDENQNTNTSTNSSSAAISNTMEDNSSSYDIRNEQRRDGYMADDSDYDASDNNSDTRSRRVNSSFRDSSQSRRRTRIMMDGSTSSSNARRDYYRSGSNDNMDASSGSQASWNVTLAEQDAQDGDDGDNDNQPKWFEKYMPDWIRKIRAWCGTIVLNELFQIVMILLIVANAICMGLATFDFIYDNPKWSEIFNWVDKGFLIMFTIELALEFGYWGYQLFWDGWLLFDFVTVISSWMLEGVQVFRSIRIFRAFRLVVRIPILKSLVYAVLHVIPRITSIMGLFCLLIYIFAVMCTTLYGDFYERGIYDENYFGRLDYSLFTLFQFVTLEGWAEVVRAIMTVDPFAKYIFGVYLTVSAFILYSLVVAVVCDSFLSVEAKIRNELKEQARLERERRKALRRAKKQKGKHNLFDGVDESGNMQNSMDFGSSLNLLDDSSRRLSSGSRYQRGPKEQAGKPPPPGRNSFETKPAKTEPPTTHGKGFFSRGIFDPSQGTPPPLPIRRSRRTLMDGSGASSESMKAAGNEIQARRNNTGSTAIDDDETSVEPLRIEHHTPVAFKSLASGGIERKKKRGGNGSSSSSCPGKRKKRRPVKNRIKRVQYRLNKLTKTQSEILNTLDDLCKEMEARHKDE